MRLRFPAGGPATLALWGSAFQAYLFLPLFDGGLAYGRDVSLHLGNVLESASLLGERPPPWDWVPDVAGGYGGPNYIFYGHLAFVFPAFLVRCGMDIVIAVKVLLAATVATGILSMGLWCSRLASKDARLQGALVGSALFTYGPYFTSLVYVRASYPEFVAYALYPLALYLAHPSGSARRQGTVGVSLVAAAILGCHTLSLILFVPVLLLYMLVIPALHEGRKALRPAGLRVLRVLALTSALAGPFLAGPLLQTGLVEIAAQFDSASTYRSTGVPWYSFCNRSTGHDVTTHLLPGRVHLLAVLLAAGLAVHERAWRRGCPLFFLVLAIAALVLSERTIAGWSVAVLPPLRYLQFPWRLLGTFNLLAAALGALSIGWLSKSRPALARLAVIALSPLCMLFYRSMIPEQGFTSFPYTNLASLRNSKTTLDHENKYMPRDATIPDLVASLTPLRAESSSMLVTLVDKGLNDYRFAVYTPVPVRATFEAFWYPGWHATLDDKEHALERESGNGLIALTIPPGLHEVRMCFRDAPARQAAKWVAALTLLGCSLRGIGALVVRCRGSRRMRRPEPMAG